MSDIDKATADMAERLLKAVKLGEKLTTVVESQQRQIEQQGDELLAAIQKVATITNEHSEVLARLDFESSMGIALMTAYAQDSGMEKKYFLGLADSARVAVDEQHPEGFQFKEVVIVKQSEYEDLMAKMGAKS